MEEERRNGAEGRSGTGGGGETERERERGKEKRVTRGGKRHDMVHEADSRYCVLSFRSYDADEIRLNPSMNGYTIPENVLLCSFLTVSDYPSMSCWRVLSVPRSSS